MKKIIHLSDIHTGADDLEKEFDQVANSLIDNYLTSKDGKHNYVVVITGDIVDDANDSNSFESAKKTIQKLKKHSDVFVIPGNHDNGTGSFPSPGFRTRFIEEMRGGAEKPFYPYFESHDGIALIGLDSMERIVERCIEAKEYDLWDDDDYSDLFDSSDIGAWAMGELGDMQLHRLDKLLASNKVKSCSYTVVCLHHHPFRRRFMHGLKDHKGLKEILHKHKVDMLMFGHNHGGYCWNGELNIRRVYDAGSSTGKGHGSSKRKGLHPAPIRIIDLSTDPDNDHPDGCVHREDKLPVSK